MKRARRPPGSEEIPPTSAASYAERHLDEREPGEKDRMTLLPQTIVEPLKKHLARVHDAHERALRAGYGGVELPDALLARPASDRRINESLPRRERLGWRKIGRQCILGRVPASTLDRV